MELLIEVAKDHNAKEVSSLALGRLMMKQPRKPFVATAYDLSTWAADPPRPIKDVVATYRTFLDRTSPLAATERLDDEGHPWEAPRNGNGNGMNGIRRNPNSQPVGAFREAARQLVAEREGRPV